VDHDIGFHRTGVATPAASVDLARHVASCPALHLGGLFFYPGHIWSTGLGQHDDLMRIDALLAETIRAWKVAGLDVETVSGGSTPTAFSSHLMTTLTEIRPGTYVFNDMNTLLGGFCTLDDCAAGLVCTVISTTVPGKAVIDAGTKTLTSDRNITQPESGHGYVLEYPDAKVVRLSEEHGELDVRGSSRTPRVGERITIVPNHICPCVNLQDVVWLRHADGRLESMSVDTRGKLS
jgi:D-serine deaminase-like pyridoxal phosphate-dependent protein